MLRTPFWFVMCTSTSYKNSPLSECTLKGSSASVSQQNSMRAQLGMETETMRWLYDSMLRRRGSDGCAGRDERRLECAGTERTSDAAGGVASVTERRRDHSSWVFSLAKNDMVRVSFWVKEQSNRTFSFSSLQRKEPLSLTNSFAPDVTRTNGSTEYSSTFTRCVSIASCMNSKPLFSSVRSFASIRSHSFCSFFTSFPNPPSNTTSNSMSSESWLFTYT